ncbi:MAG: 2-hydroxyacyl-CoA dehydratase [Blautia sp.]|nr:2-hydroxyacyl-CoA dehydratase [Blautia sp.]
MRDLKHFLFFEELVCSSNNDLVRKAKEQGRVCAAFVCENTPEPLFNLKGCFGVRLTAPNTGSTDIANYYMTSLLCETSRALLERAIEGGYNFADCIIAPDGCTMMNRCIENMELARAVESGSDAFFYEHMEIPMKTDENGVALLVRQCRNHILTPLNRTYGIDISDEAMREAVRSHNEVCDLIRQIGEFRKADKPAITGYEFSVIVLATYVCPKDLLVEPLRETLEELKTREPDEKGYRARLLVVGAEMDDPEFIRLIEECGAYVCADRYCFGSFPGREPIELTEGEDVLTQICRHYTYQCQCPRQMNMDKVYARKAYVDALAKEYGADGILYNQIKFCDPWAYERVTGAATLREEYGYPVLSVDRPYNIHSSAGQMRTRVQAFVESIEVKKLREAR